MISTHYTLTNKFAAAVTAVTAAALTALYAEPAPLSSAFVIPGAHVSYNMREGYRKFDGINEYQHVTNTNPFMFGGYVGKRFPLSSANWRLQAGAEVSWGSVKDDEFDVDLTSGDNIPAQLRSYYLTGGVIAEAHFLLPYSGNTAFVSFGPGVHAVRFNAGLKTMDGEHIGSDLDGRYRVRYTVSANLGIGVDHRISDRMALSVGYGFRFWQTARYTETGLFPMGADYREFFYSHALFVQFLVPGLNGKSRFAQ